MIGVDIGTTNTKAIAFSVEGKVLAQSNNTYLPLATVAGRHEMDPAVLFNAVCQSLQGITSQCGAAACAGIAFSSAMHSLMAVDENGKPLTNFITWADLRSSEQALQLRATEAGQRIYQHTGTPVHPMSPLCKLLWIKQEQPALWKSAYKFIGIKEYVFYRFFGQYLIDHSIASATGLFDIRRLTWYPEALQLAGIGMEKLSAPVSTTHQVTGLKKEYTALLGINADVPFILGGSDGCLANLGSGATQPGDLSLTIGTSGAVRMMCQQPQHDPQQRIFNYLLTEQWFVSGGPINNGAVLLQWYATRFLGRQGQSTEDINWFIAQAAQVPAGAEGLIFLPYIQGERAPVWDPRAKGLFFGLQAHHTQAHNMRAIIEGINFALYQVTRSLEQTIGPVSHIIASGGFTRSPQWLQWLADAFGKPISVSSNADASATGAALLGWQALGYINALEPIPPAAAALFTPNQQHKEVYARNYAIYSQLYERLKDLFLE